MSRLFSRIDANQPEIVKALRKAGASVQHLSAVGQGCPDLLVAVNRQVFLIEVKDGAKIPSAQKLTPDQVIWHAGWRAEVHIVNSIEGALEVAQFYKTKGE